MHSISFAVLAVAAIAATCTLGAPTRVSNGAVNVAVSADGSYSVSVNGKVWLNSAPTYFTVGGKTYSTADQSLVLAKTTTGSGGDSGGSYTSTRLEWTAGSTTVYTSFRNYGSHVVFSQEFPSAVSGSALPDKSRDKVSASFPAFKLETPDEPRGYLSFSGDMVGWEAHAGQWDNKTDGISQGSKNSAPLVIFNADASESIVVSAFNAFMVHNVYVDSDQNGEQIVNFGLQGCFDNIPSGFSVETIISASHGINHAMTSWGDILLSRYGKEREGYKSDHTLRTLGYSTDNGAYYYYQTEPNKNYEDTIIDVAKYAAEENIPYKYILLDSWWYFKDPKGDGVVTWDAMPSVFPHGLEYLYNVTNWPTQLHNRFWSVHNTYAKQNGGPWEFIVEDKFALPVDPGFFDWLMLEKKKTGMLNYEQDWLDVEYDNLNAFASNITLARDWMNMMGSAAERNGVTVQLCMSHPRHVMQSLESRAMTNARASGDYHPGNSQWNTGRSSIFAWAVGIAPSKDNYWSTPEQSGTHYGPNTREYRNRMQAAVISFTTGPVAPSDKVGSSDAALIRKSCTSGGMLLQPDKPASEIDACMIQEALGQGGIDGKVWSSHVDLAPGVRYAYVFGIDVHQAANVTLGHIEYPDPTAKLTVFESNATSAADIFHVDNVHPLPVAVCGEIDFQLYTLAPPMPNGWTLLGEMDKWVSVSRQRFNNLQYTEDSLSVAITGEVGETVNVSFYSPDGKLVHVACTIPLDSHAIVGIDSNASPFCNAST